MSKEDVLAKTDGGKAFYDFAMGGSVEKKKKYKSTFYDDTKPGMSFFEKDEQWFFKDFGNDEYQGDVFNFAGDHYGLDPTTQLNEIIERMTADLLLSNGAVAATSNNGTGYNGTTASTTSTLTPGKDYFQSKDANPFKVWYDYGNSDIIDPVLARYQVSAWEKYNDKNSKGESYTIYNKQYPIFSMPFGDGDKCFKIYQPGVKSKGRWLGVKDKSLPDVYGLDQLPLKCDKILVVEGPLSDMIVAAAYGCHVIALDNAGSKLPEDLVKKLKEKTDNLILCLDNDSAGLEAMKNLSAEHQLPYMVFPQTLTIDGKNYDSTWGKDISDYFATGKKCGKTDKFIEYFHYLLISSIQLPKPSALLQAILDTQAMLLERVKKPIEFVAPLVKHNEDDLFYPNSLNVIQGQKGSHKSRYAGDVASVIIHKKLKARISGMERQQLYGGDVMVCYIDTERPLKEELPYSMQQIILRAGYTLEDMPPSSKFQFTSFIETPRKERREAIKQYIEYIRLTTKKHVVFILDVITDILGDFNEVAGTFELIDYLNVLINTQEVTFFLIIHENPGNTTGNKARGHTGTEAANKASSIVQIGREPETDIINVKSLKVRHGPPDVSYPLMWDNETKGLVEATGEDVAMAMASKDSKDLRPSEAITLIAEILTNTETLNRGQLEKAIQEEYKKQTDIELSDRTVRRRIDVFVNSKNPATIQHSDGKTYQLLIDKKGNSKMFSLQEKTTENDEDPPF